MLRNEAPYIWGHNAQSIGKCREATMLLEMLCCGSGIHAAKWPRPTDGATSSQGSAREHPGTFWGASGFTGASKDLLGSLTGPSGELLALQELLFRMPCFGSGIQDAKWQLSSGKCCVSVEAQSGGTISNTVFSAIHKHIANETSERS